MALPPNMKSNSIVMSRYRFCADVRVPAEISHTGDARTIAVEIFLDTVSSVEATQKAADLGKAKHLLLTGPL